MKGDDCTTVRRLLALRPEEWNHVERDRVQRHVVTCERCTVLARTYAEQDRLLHSLPPSRLGAVEREQMLLQIRGRQRRPFSRLSWALGVIAGITILVVLTLLATLLIGPGGPLESGKRASSTPLPSAVTQDLLQLETVATTLTPEGTGLNRARPPDPLGAALPPGSPSCGAALPPAAQTSGCGCDQSSP